MAWAENNGLISVSKVWVDGPSSPSWCKKVLPRFRVHITEPEAEHREVGCPQGKAVYTWEAGAQRSAVKRIHGGEIMISIIRSYLFNDSIGRFFKRSKNLTIPFCDVFLHKKLARKRADLI